MFKLGRTSACQNRVCTWNTIPHSPRVIGAIFTFQGLQPCLERRRRRSNTKVYYQRTKSSWPPAMAVPVLQLYYQRTSSRSPATAVSVVKLYYQRTKMQPAAGDGRSSTKDCIARERKSSRPPATAVSVPKLYYQRAKIQPAAGDDHFSTSFENPTGRRPF